MPEQNTTTKRCSVCERELPLDAFSKGAGRHGRDGYCKDCRREYLREWSKRNREKIAAAQRRSKARYPDRHRARVRVHDAVERGELIRAEACERCGKAGYTNAHHADYSKPLEVEWLCKPCHYAEHAEEAA